ncbi:hypothetical protein CMI47_22100 [Candidatus Pacearchaeota archaeon]|jgi:hypothetical protein|nr:hypothetical protein [Candidatus Pacearchaeota archaeon]|tara:strand:- start:97 stop:546 length:450 start_codon:yes stop_codon:yes gene_type:complete
MPARYDINAYQGDTFTFHVQYQDENGNAISLPSDTYSSTMQVRRSVDATNILLHLTSSPYGATAGCTAGISGGSFTGATAYANCTGGIVLNRTIGNTGGLTGGVYVFAGATAMGYVPFGNHLYDLEITATGESTRLIEGRFDCVGEITR